MSYLNLGCGCRFHPGWINIDMVSTGPNVIAHDLSHGIPLADGTCDVVYHSHVLEHIRRREALPFMRECWRVLRPGGILRVAVPDLEAITRLYLEKLEAVLSSQPGSAEDYNWMVLEMYDQTVREQWKSEMWHYLNGGPVPNEAFVRKRIGSFKGPPPDAKGEPVFGQTDPASRWSLAQGARNLGKRLLNELLWIKAVRALVIGRFRLSGEIHQWMYDRYSLAQLMKEAGFPDPLQQSATKSLIPAWQSFHLDTSPDGSIHKPDSLFMEAIKA